MAWQKLAPGSTTLCLTLNTDKSMKKRLLLLLFGLLAFSTVQAQFAKPLKKNTAQKKVFSMGLTGSYAANDMVYSAVTKSSMVPLFAP